MRNPFKNILQKIEKRYNLWRYGHSVYRIKKPPVVSVDREKIIETLKPMEARGWNIVDRAKQKAFDKPSEE